MKKTRTEVETVGNDRVLQLFKLAVALLLLLAIAAILLSGPRFPPRAPVILHPQPDAILRTDMLTVTGTGTRGTRVEVVEVGAG